MSDLVTQAREALEGVTPAPWAPGTTGIESGDRWHVLDFDSMMPVAHIAARDGSNEDRREPDARFIAAARTLVPELADALQNAQITLEQDLIYMRRIEAENERLRGAVEAVLRLADEYDRQAEEAAAYGLNDHAANLVVRAWIIRVEVSTALGVTPPPSPIKPAVTEHLGGRDAQPS